ncbi:MAG: hypothetical protein GXY09_02370 [Bacteroidales bacterium]|nr:hypothetical protein [Bacteroidales bacterium]
MRGFWGKVQYDIPVWGSCVMTTDALKRGDYLNAGGHLMTAAMELFTLGASSGIIGSTRTATAATRSVVSGVAAKNEVQYSDDLVKAARSLYPKQAGKTQLHHITPKYLGGATNGPLVPLDGAYHQQITNSFRQLWPYGKGPITDPVMRRQIIDQVYKQFPLPSGFTY